MKKFLTSELTNIVINFFVVFLFAFASFNIYTDLVRSALDITNVHASSREDEDHEDEEDEEDEDEEDRSDEDDYQAEEEFEYIYVSTPIEEVVETPAETLTGINYVKVIDAGYDRDTDDDLLVDAIDPNPTIPQKELYTDDDADGVPNAYDAHPGEDDFLYLDYTDENNNGILDLLEYLE